MSIEQSRAQKLRELRRNLPTSPLKAAKSVAGSLSLSRYINPFMDWLFGIALALAILKDILDFVGIGSFPAIGTVVTFIVSATIGFIMILTGSFSTARWARRAVILLGGTLVEFVFGIDFLPVETAIVILVFKSTLEGRRLKQQERATKEAQMQNINAGPEFA